MSNSPRNLTRNQLAEFLPNQRAVRAFEQLLKSVGDLLPSDVATINRLIQEAYIEAANASGAANSALDQLNGIVQDAAINAGTADAKATQALDALQKIAASLQFIATAPATRNDNSVSTDYVDFRDNGWLPAYKLGRVWFGPTGTLEVAMGNGNITQQVGEEFFRYGKASSAISDTNLQLVYKTGVVGASGVIKFAPAVAGITDPDQILGIATESIATNSFGRITTMGVVHGINTTGSAYGETWADNDDIWYNPVTGGLTKTKPSAPNVKVQVGTVINAGGGGSGSFSVKIGSSSSLGGTDSNVQFSSLASGNIIIYDAVAQYFKNAFLTAGSNVTITNAPGSITIGVTGAPPTGTAGGVLSGSYPNPGFAVDMATQAELDAHTTNTSNPHSVTKTQVGLSNVTNDAQLKQTSNLSDLASTATARTNLGLGSSATLNVDTDGTLSANSDTRVPSQKAVKSYVDNAVTGLLDLKGSIDCSANPNYPAASKGDAYYVTVAGKIGGASGISVDVGDMIVASADNAGGTQASVGSSWFILEHNLTGALLASNNLSDLTNASTARTNLGVAIGTNVQAWDADLDAIAALAGTSGLLKKTAANTWSLDTTAYGTGSVTSVGLSLPAIFTVSGSPVTTSGTLSATLASQTANYIFAAPNGSAGAPSFRAIVAADIPTLNQNTTGQAGSVANTLTRGSYLTGNNFNGSAATTWAVDADSANTASKVVVRDASGNFSAGTVTTTTVKGGNLQLTGNTFSSTNTNGDINVTPNGTGAVIQAQSSSTRYWNIAQTHPGYLGYGGIVELGISTNQYGSIGAQIRPRAYGNVNEQKIGLSFFVQTGASGSATPRAHLTDGGVWMPAVDGTQNIGTNSFYDGTSSVNMRWNTIYATNGTINTSDEKEKENIGDSDLGLDFVMKLRPVTFTWKDFDPTYKDAFDPEGDYLGKVEVPKRRGRTHYGLLAQQVAAAAESCGVPVARFAPYSLSNPDDPNSGAGLRYHELMAPMIKAIQELKAEFDAYKASHP